MNKIQGDNFSIENLNETIAKIYPKNSDIDYTGFDNNILILDFGEKNKGDLATCNFIFESKTYKIKNTSASCGCTNPIFRDTDIEGRQHLTVVYDPSKISRNVSKAVTLYLTGGKSIKINLIINKPQ